MDKETVRKAAETKEYLVLIGVAAGVYFGFRYLSPLVTPFLFAFAFVAMLHPWLERVHNKCHIKKGFLTAGALLLLTVTAGVGIWGLLVFIVHKVSDMFLQLDIFEEKFCLFLGNCCDGLEQRFGMDSEGVETYILERVNIFIENFQVQVVPKLMNRSVDYMKGIAGIVGFLAIMIIAAVLLSKDYRQIMTKLHARKELACVLTIGKRIFGHVGTFIKAQIIIMLIISGICAAVLFFAGIEGGIALGLFSGVMDMLPFIGTGLVLMPLAFWQILNGYYAKAVICVILYVVCAVTREFLEPKLIGEKVGILPIAILFSLYAGVKLFGVTGIIKGPLALITIFEVYQYLKEMRKVDENDGQSGN